jgi:hypothetical protein
MELWILMGLALIAVATVGVIRLRKPRRRVAKSETGNIYPLW